TRFSRDWSSDVCSSDLSGISHVEQRAVRGEAEAVGAVEVLGRDGGLARVGIEPVHAGRQLELRFLSLVVPEDAVAGVGEPDRPRSEERRVGKEWGSGRS